MYDENASKLPLSSDGNGGLRCSFIYSRKLFGLSNVKMSGDAGFVASGADIMNPCTVISMSSKVSANTCLTTFKAASKILVFMPTAPIHTFSFVPIAINDVCRPLMFGAFLTVYPASVNMSPKCIQSAGCASDCAGVNVVGVVTAVWLLLSAGVWLVWIDRLRRGGRVRCASDSNVAFVCVLSEDA